MLQPMALGTEHVSPIFPLGTFDFFVIFLGTQRTLPLIKATGRICSYVGCSRGARICCH